MVQFNWKGTWIPNLPYNENVVVEYQNVDYISLTFVEPNDVPPLDDPYHWDEMIVIFNTPTPTPSTTLAPTLTPTPSVTPTLTSTQTPTVTPTPTTSSIPITGYGYTLVQQPYQPPSSGNTIFPDFNNTPTGGTLNPNTFDLGGIYWNSIDNTSVDRTSYYSAMTSHNVMFYLQQNSETVIYSATTNSFGDNLGPGGPVFFHNPGLGSLTLIQSAATDFVSGGTVYISYSII